MALFTAAALKALIPALINLAANIVPMFGAKRAEGSPSPNNDPSPTSLQAQIVEIQSAVTAQGVAIQKLSKELEQIFISIAVTLDLQEKKLRQQRVISFFAILIALIAVVEAFLLKK